MSAENLTEKAQPTGIINAVATSHLDTSWSWNFERTIDEYLPETFEENADLMKDYPDYKFNFEGAYRYQLLKEYYPEKFEKLKEYISKGQWNVSGTALENGDVNVPSPEALFRNILYGNNYFLDNFGVTSKDIYLPDCFGFGYALPSIIAHSNLLGFSTQKLNWGNTFPEEKLPFDLGIWKGPDGKTAIADITLNGYWRAHTDGMRENNEFLDRLSRSEIGRITALFGSCGDRGGAPSNLAVKKILEEKAENDSEPVKVYMSTTDGIMKSLTPSEREKLPVYDGELVLRQHGAGSYTSKVMSKRWNRKAEEMAYAAELANVVSDYLGAAEYPKKQFEEYWTRVIAHQFHDDITGTSNYDSYLRNYNDLMISIKQFANEYQSGVLGVIREMDTTAGDGEVAVVVHNSISVSRKGVVVGTVTLKNPATDVVVTDDSGAEVPSQILWAEGCNVKIAFVAEVASFGYRKYLVKGVEKNTEESGTLSVTNNSLSNEKYTVLIDENGDISSVYDKELKKELLSAPMRLGIFQNNNNYWAAWELNIDDYALKKPQNYVGGTPQIEIVEKGPARVAIKITRTYNNSTFQQTVSLCAGGKIVQVDNVVDWHEEASLLKAEFNLKPTNPNATYDLGLGTITRGNNTANKAEVPLQKWADLTDVDGTYGVSVINDCKYGMDKYDDNTLRLTLIHTPKENFCHSFYGPSGQSAQDFGENRFSFAIYGHAGDYASSDVQHIAEAFNRPFYAYQADEHEGFLGTNYSFGSINNGKVLVRAVKKAEKSDEIIVRVNEGSGAAQKGVLLSLGNGIESAREVYATEENIGEAQVTPDGQLKFDIGRYEVKTFAITLKAPEKAAAKIESTSLALPYNTDVYSGNENKGDSDMTYVKDAYPCELVPDNIISGGISYTIGPKADGSSNALRAKGQTIPLPEGYSTLHLLAASINGDKKVQFNVNGKAAELEIADFGERVAQWDICYLNEKGYVKEQTPAFVATHRHIAGKDSTAKTTYMFSYSIDVSGASQITLPDDRDIIIFAAALTNDSGKKAYCISELYDKREKSEAGAKVEQSDTLESCLEKYSKINRDIYSEKSLREFDVVYELAAKALSANDVNEYEKNTLRELLTKAYENLAKVKDSKNTLYGCQYSAYSGRVETENDSNGDIISITDTTYVSYKGIDFGTDGADILKVSHSGKDTTNDARIIVFKGDSPAGEALGTLSIPATGEWDNYAQNTLKLKKKLVGEQDICLVFRSESATTCHLKSLEFTR